MKQQIIWVIEVREMGDTWRALDRCFLRRSSARKAQAGQRKHWRMTRVVKYVREAS